MTNDQVERAIEFLLDQDAKLSVRLDKLSLDVQNLTNDVQNLTRDVQNLTRNVQALTRNVDELTNVVGSLQTEMRGGFDNLIIANEVTRKLAEDVARLAVQTSQRVTILESNS
jgi:prefoldin subunit 5